MLLSSCSIFLDYRYVLAIQYSIFQEPPTFQSSCHHHLSQYWLYVWACWDLHNLVWNRPTLQTTHCHCYNHHDNWMNLSKFSQNYSHGCLRHHPTRNMCMYHNHWCQNALQARSVCWQSFEPLNHRQSKNVYNNSVNIYLGLQKAYCSSV